MKPYFSELLPVLADRSKWAAISRLGFANVPLRRHLAELADHPYGEVGAFLADPTFEAVFGWRKGDLSMSDLSGSLLSPELVKAMDEPPADLVADYRFSRFQYPYIHQLEAWRILRETTPRSLVVASGTGSGKTECFMVPILDRLIRMQQEQGGRLIGVRALFLYPLNALINSQRERLKAWTQGFGKDIRFCLYNGNTPERPEPSRFHSEHPSEVMDRETLRSSPPPILVTNATMLEYMLVRTVDAPILAQSQGTLEWVVLDEAHTYIGSQAAEAALLIRRLLLAFGVTPEQVRFVATSATIGDPEGEAGQTLKRFLAEVAGVALDRVHLVAGQRQVPPALGKKALKKLPFSQLTAIEADCETSPRRYDALAENATAGRIRGLFVEDAKKPPVARLSEVCSVLFGREPKYTREQQQEALRWLDLMSGTRDNSGEGRDDGEAFLPLRAHLFHQTLSGLWACADPSCPKKDGSPLEDSQWPFGKVYLDPRKHCDCGSPAYEVVACGGCGSVHLLAGEHRGRLTHLQPSAALDEFELEVEADTDVGDDDESSRDDESAGRQNKVLIVNRTLPHVGPLDIDQPSRAIVEPTPNTLRVLVHEDNGAGLICPVCEGRETPRRMLFIPSRLGAPFLIGNILPTLLEYAPDGTKPADHPCRGRRLLSFNDSRQGTARMAAKLQQDAERKRVRGLVYHLTLQNGRAEASIRTESLLHEIQTLEALTPSNNAALVGLIDAKKLKLAELSTPVPISFNELALQLANQGRDFDRMLTHYRRHAPGTFDEATGPIELAKMFLVCEFGRRPRRLNNLESMGMVAVHYPALDSIRSVPPGVLQATGFDVTTWRNFLKVCLDYFVRGGGTLAISPSWRSWLGMPFPQTVLVSRDEQQTARNQRRWPRVQRSGLRSLLIRVLAYVLNADVNTAQGEDRIDAVLQEAWDALTITGLLRQSGDGRILVLDHLSFAPMAQGWICPVTRRFLDTTVREVTPYLPEMATKDTAICERVDIPLFDEPFGGVSDDQERIRLGREWLARHRELDHLRELGLWSDLNDRTIELTPYLVAAEHSAQQDARTLQQYEKAFKQGEVNLLSCSTTMEMGIDIGGISIVAMNNVPPHPSNYLQRAGRAGRRREARSLAMTLCKSNPHDQAVFSNTRWAFDNRLPAPRVSLDSPIIVQRHIHSFLLSKFLVDALSTSGQEQSKLTCGLFFLGEKSLIDRFSAWCRGFSQKSQEEITRGLRLIVRHSVFAGQDLGRITDNAAEAMDDLAGRWRIEWQHLETEEIAVRQDAGDSSPAFRAVALQKGRLSGEYLLRELATRGFLPAYGFPTNIAPFDNLTRARFQRDLQRAGKDREDNRYRRRELASRDLTTALREYAPGSEVVMDGLVYRSAGVTLNWHIPAGQQEAREIQNIRQAWRCHQCGASGSSHSLEAARHCDACGSAIEAAHIREYLEPAGFAVDFYKEPDNDITSQHFVPVESPWIDAEGDWFPLTNPALGRFRVTPRGHIFHQSRGIHGTGYALCLECGRAEPMMPDGSRPDVLNKPHQKLRRSREVGLYCPGSNDSWKIKDGITLGHETWTDVFEIQLKTDAGTWINSRVAAFTLAIALRDALAELIGVQATELGCDVKQSRPESATRAQSILIFDRYAAGYASNAERYLDRLFHLARQRLNCPSQCDSACPQCVLDYDQRFAADSLDRHAALAVLTETWLHDLRLPDEYAYFGDASRLEHQHLPEAIWRTVSKKPINGVRFFVAGAMDTWDIGPSPLRELVLRLAGQGLAIDIVLPRGVVETLDDGDRYLIASLADHPRVTLRELDASPRCQQGWLVAEATGNGTVRWALGTDSSLAFGPDWGNSTDPLIMAEHAFPLPLPSEALTAESVRPRTADGGDREMEVHHELDGPIQGFGKRFWQHLAAEHSASKALLANTTENVVSLTYRDRYLFTPLSVALLAEIASGLKLTLGHGRWTINEFQVITTSCRVTGENRTRNRLWSDWSNTKTRDSVLVATLSSIGIKSSVQSADATTTGHGRLLEVTFSSGRRLTLRLDQGVSYWRSAHSNSHHTVHFDLNIDNADLQGDKLAKLGVRIEGGWLPTQLFVKVR